MPGGIGIIIAHNGQREAPAPPPRQLARQHHPTLATTIRAHAIIDLGRGDTRPHALPDATLTS